MQTSCSSSSSSSSNRSSSSDGSDDEKRESFSSVAAAVSTKKASEKSATKSSSRGGGGEAYVFEDEDEDEDEDDGSDDEKLSSGGGGGGGGGKQQKLANAEETALGITLEFTRYYKTPSADSNTYGVVQQGVSANTRSFDIDELQTVVGGKSLNFPASPLEHRWQLVEDVTFKTNSNEMLKAGTFVHVVRGSSSKENTLVCTHPVHNGSIVLSKRFFTFTKLADSAGASATPDEDYM